MHEVFVEKYPGPISLAIDLIVFMSKSYNTRALSLYVDLKRQDLPKEEELLYLEKLNTVFNRNKIIMTMREATFQFQLTFQVSYRALWTVSQGIQQIQQDIEMTALRRAIIFCTFEAGKLMLRHQDDRVMIPVYRADGRLIRAFRHYKSMKKFVNDLQCNVYSAAHSILSCTANLVKQVRDNLRLV